MKRMVAKDNTLIPDEIFKRYFQCDELPDPISQELAAGIAIEIMEKTAKGRPTHRDTEWIMETLLKRIGTSSEQPQVDVVHLQRRNLNQAILLQEADSIKNVLEHRITKDAVEIDRLERLITDLRIENKALQGQIEHMKPEPPSLVERLKDLAKDHWKRPTEEIDSLLNEAISALDKKAESGQ